MFGKEMELKIEKDLFTGEYLLTQDNMEIKFETKEELMTYLSKEIDFNLR